MGAHVNRQPVGAVACISPYNFPLTNVAGKIAPALAVGCTVVVKPAPQDPLAILVLAEIMHEVGFPPGVVNVITGAEAAPAAALTSSPDIDMVSFTGSTSIGQRIYQAGAMGMKRMLLELGGKGACVVLDDADTAKAITAIASVWTFHSGQICTAPHTRDRAPQQVRRDGRQARGVRGQPQGRRPARPRHDRRPRDLGHPARPHREPRGHGRERRRHDRRRRPAPRVHRSAATTWRPR